MKQIALGMMNYEMPAGGFLPRSSTRRVSARTGFGVNQCDDTSGMIQAGLGWC